MVRRAIFSQVCFQFVTANFLDRERGSWRRLQRLAVNAVLTEPEHDLTRPNHNLTEQRDRERGAYGGLQPNTILTEPEHDLTRPNHNLTVVNTILTEPERDTKLNLVEQRDRERGMGRLHTIERIFLAEGLIVRDQDT